MTNVGIAIEVVILIAALQHSNHHCIQHLLLTFFAKSVFSRRVAIAI